MPLIEPGQQAPDFELADQDGRATRLSDFRGQTVVLYFYPRADTPGCTAQACGVRDHSGDYDRAGAVVLGVSPDPVQRIKAFHDKYDLNFALLSDADHSVSEAYGVWVQRSRNGRTFWGVQRSTFIIDHSGQVVRVLPKVSPQTHDEEVLAVVESLPTRTPPG
jgi:peroxiredoxin Q/BCP